MPRLSHSLLHKARSISPLLPVLLQQTRSLAAAIAELRWLQSHARQSYPRSRTLQQNLLRKLVASRGRGVPLQYVLGTEFFGDLELKVEKGILIPRWETASLVNHLSKLLLSKHKETLPRPLKILDLCTGSGCISLLLSSLLSDACPTHTLGIDISQTAVSLSTRNLQHCIRTGQLSPASDDTIHFARADILSPSLTTSSPILDGNSADRPGQWDVLVSNPPYISPHGFARSTGRSVRNYEPRLALVPSSSSPNPPQDHNNTEEDDRTIGLAFYEPLLTVAKQVNAKLVLLELGDAYQARRILSMALAASWSAEVWRDYPEASRSTEDLEYSSVEDRMSGGGIENEMEVDDEGFEGKNWLVTSSDSGVPETERMEVQVRGRGKVRGIVLWREEGGEWLGKN